LRIKACEIDTEELWSSSETSGTLYHLKNASITARIESTSAGLYQLSIRCLKEFLNVDWRTALILLAFRLRSHSRCEIGGRLSECARLDPAFGVR
jgi:hypothetical protein